MISNGFLYLHVYEKENTKSLLLRFINLHEIVEGLCFHCSLSVCLCVCVCVSVCPDFLWTKFQSNGCTDLDAVFAKWLLTALTQTLLKLVTLSQRSRSRWPKMYVKMMKKNRQKFKSFSKSDFIIRLEILSPSFWYQIWPYCKISSPKNYQ